MLSARERFERWMQTADEPTRDLINEMMQGCSFKVLECDERTSLVPEYIVGGPWPSECSDTVESSCQFCGQSVALHLESGFAAAKEFPEARIACIICALHSIKESL